jgi:uncharacterized protein (DUF983 family)
MYDDNHDYQTLSPWSTGVRCRCPRCGEGAVFRGFLQVRAECGSCGLDLSEVDTGDGPAVFIIFIVGFIVVALAAWVELAYMPPIWVHMMIWIPTIIILSLGLLRPFKATLLSLQYVHRAREGRLDE